MTALGIGAALYLGWAALLFVMQRSMMYPGRNAAPPPMTGEAVPHGVEPIRIPFSPGSAEAWFMPAPGSAPAPAVIFAHGNAERIENAVPDARDLNGLGLSVLLVEYPGYGRSDGTPSRGSIGEAYLAAYDWLAARPEIDAGRIVGMGRSLGSGAITDLARHRELKALVLLSAYTSVAHFARRYLLPGVLARDRFDNLEVVRSFPGPVLLVHGRQDPVIPFAHGERLAASSPTAELLALDCGHNDCPPDRAAYMSALEDFLLRSGVVVR